MEGICKAKFVRCSPIKIMQVLRIIRRKKVIDAFNILKNLNKSSSEIIYKAIKSALANAKGLKSPDKYFVKQCFVTKGPYFKRIMPRAFGRAAMFTRKTAHLTVVVSDKK
ncbi:MAG: 50S ribosomal protein L22 [Endomicrobiia bacterium]